MTFTTTGNRSFRKFVSLDIVQEGDSQAIHPPSGLPTLKESDKEEVIDQEGKAFPKEVSKLSKELSIKYKDWLKSASPRASPRGLSRVPTRGAILPERRNTCKDVCSASP